MMRTLLAILVLTAVATAAPIPKALKKKPNSADFLGFWEQTGSNSNGKEGGVTHAKYWKIEPDKFYYGLPDTNTLKSTASMKISTPDESQPNIIEYGGSLNRLEVHDDVLTWVFGTSKTEAPDGIEPRASRIIYYFKRVPE
jgi:hypothetical protein